MFISCILLKSKDEIKKLSKEELPRYYDTLVNEYYRHMRCVQENPFQPKDLKKISGEHMHKLVKLMAYIEPRLR